MARILLLTQIVPYPPNAGPKVKTWNVLRYLCERGHDLTLVSFARPGDEAYVPALKELCERVYTVPIYRSRLADLSYLLRSYATRLPFLIERDNLHPMQRLVDDLVCSSHFDFIHADQLTMLQFSLHHAHGSPGGNPKIILDAHNAVWTILEQMQRNGSWFLKPILGVEVRRLKRYEANSLSVVDHLLVTTEMDRERFESALEDSKAPANKRIAPITVIPIAVDTAELRPIQRKPGSKNIVTLGTLHYPPNADGIRWFLKEVFPRVRQSVPDARLTVIGKNPPADFLDLAVRYPDAINVTGYVPDLIPYLEESSLMVVPVRAGGGMRVRILEALAYGMPVVTTMVGLEGIQAEPGKDVLVANTPADFADSVIRLLRDGALQHQLATNGRRLAENKYDWRVTLTGLDEIY